jgi:MoxR-like ATPase
MMIVCITCRIPLIVVGNPGTSKTLAVTILTQKLDAFSKARLGLGLG